MNTKEIPLFTLVRFNPRRAQRGAEAAEVEVTWPDGETETLWMSRKDLRDNAKEYGSQAGITAALDAYRRNARAMTPGANGTPMPAKDQP
jgi:hypothetical protein